MEAITINQKDVLKLVFQERSISLDSGRIHKNTGNSLSLKGMLKLNQYANGYFWEITDKGIDAIMWAKTK